MTFFDIEFDLRMLPRLVQSENILVGEDNLCKISPTDQMQQLFRFCHSHSHLSWSKRLSWLGFVAGQVEILFDDARERSSTHAHGVDSCSYSCSIVFGVLIDRFLPVEHPGWREKLFFTFLRMRYTVAVETSGARDSQNSEIEKPF